MQYRNFGQAGWLVSEIGFGGRQTRSSWGTVDDDNSMHSLLHAWDQVINFVIIQLEGSLGGTVRAAE